MRPALPDLLEESLMVADLNFFKSYSIMVYNITKQFKHIMQHFLEEWRYSLYGYTLPPPFLSLYCDCIIVQSA